MSLDIFLNNVTYFHIINNLTKISYFITVFNFEFKNMFPNVILLHFILKTIIYQEFIRKDFFIIKL